MICELLNLPNPEIDLRDWDKIIETIRNPKGIITVGIVGKYVQHQDAYKSVFEALFHGALAAGYKINIKRFDADKLPTDPKQLTQLFSGCDGYLVPGGYGERGWEGKIQASKFCRENKIPYFGICFGMQVMAVEFARHAVGLEEANSTEIAPETPHPVISLLSEQRGVQDLGGTMRLGAYPCELTPNSHAHKAYKSLQISERHRHRYEFNNAYKEMLEKHGFQITGTFKDDNLCEIAEIKDHPWMVGVQFHPEFKSKPTDPHPLFRDFIHAMINYRKNHHAGIPS
jgi:CTP synthase